MKIIQPDGKLSELSLCEVNADIKKKKGESRQCGFRPIFLLSQDAKIISGDGKTEDTAYILGI